MGCAIPGENGRSAQRIELPAVSRRRTDAASAQSDAFFSAVVELHDNAGDDDVSLVLPKDDVRGLSAGLGL